MADGMTDKTNTTARTLLHRIERREARVGVVGLGYVGLGLLHAKGATLSYADPHISRLAGRQWAGGLDLEAVELTPGIAASVDCVVVLTDHTAFDYATLAASASLIVDTRNAIKPALPHVFRLGGPRRVTREPEPREPREPYPAVA